MNADTRIHLAAKLNRERRKLAEARKDVARLQEQTRKLKIENQMLSYRLAEKELR